MKLALDCTQRLNVHAVLGAQRGSVDDVRAIWKLQDKIDLTAEEKKKINYRTLSVNGMQQVLWDLIEAPLKEYELTADEFGRINRAIQEFPGASGSDRRWLEPLLAQLEMIEKAREKKKHSANAAD